MKKLLLFVVSIVFLQTAFTQVNIQADSLQDDTLHLTEQQIVQGQQQKNIDSLIKLRLERELELNANDSKRKQDLEAQLKQIAQKDSLRRAEQMEKIELLRSNAKGYPVLLREDTVLLIYTRLGSFSAADRAAAISARIEKLYNDDFLQLDSLSIQQGENTVDIVYDREMVVMSVSEIDGLYYNRDQNELGTEYLNKIKTAIQGKRAANSIWNWVKRIGLVLSIILGIFLLFHGINRLFRFFSKKLIAKKDQYFKGITFNNFKLFEPKQHLHFVLRVLGLLKIITILLALYLSLPLLFSIFPQTKDYTYTLLNWIISPAKSVINNIIAYLPNLFTILVVYFFTSYAIKGVHYLANEVEKGNLTIKGFYPDWTRPTYNIVKFLLYAFMMIVIFPYLPGSGSPAFQGISVFLGILFSLGSSSAIANMVAGLVITYMRPFKVGDRVKIGEVTGDVLEKTMLVTRLRTIKNEEITVPNATVLSSHTVNYTAGSQNTGLIVHTTITLGYDVPWKKVYLALTDAALRTELILTDPAPFVLQTSLEDFYVSYQINAYTKFPSSQAKIYSDLHQHIQDCCNEVGIEILSPHYKAMRDGNQSTIPEDYLAKDYETPSFRVIDPTRKKA